MRFIRLCVIKKKSRVTETESGKGKVILGCKQSAEKGPLANLCPIKMQIQDPNWGYIH